MQVDNMVSRASRRLFMLRFLKAFRLPIDDLVTVYTSYVSEFMKKIPFSQLVESWHAYPYSTCRQVKISFLGMPQIAHFQVEKWKSSYRGRGDTPLPHPSPRSVATLPRKDCAPQFFFGSVRHWSHPCSWLPVLLWFLPTLFLIRAWISGLSARVRFVYRPRPFLFGKEVWAGCFPLAHHRLTHFTLRSFGQAIVQSPQLSIYFTTLPFQFHSQLSFFAPHIWDGAGGTVPPPPPGGGTQILFGRGCAAEASKPVPIFKGHFGGKGYPLLRVWRKRVPIIRDF